MTAAMTAATKLTDAKKRERRKRRKNWVVKILR
jgi:hypothetical protein